MSIHRDPARLLLAVVLIGPMVTAGCGNDSADDRTGSEATAGAGGSAPGDGAGAGGNAGSSGAAGASGGGGTGGAAGAAGAGGSMSASGKGSFYYTLEKRVFRIAAKEGAVAENVSTALAKLSPGTADRRLNASTNGEHLLVVTDRFGCSGECMAILPRDLSRGSLVLPGGVEVAPEGMAAVGDTGDFIVYASQEGPHEVDLFVTRLAAGKWSAGTLLTGSSTSKYNNMPALSLDGKNITFDCGSEPYPEGGNNDACEVKLDGTGFKRLVRANTLPNARNTYVQNPHLGPDGLLFESSWPIDGDMPETIWLLPSAGGPPQPIARRFPNAVSPCALSDGRFGMLWLGRPGNAEGKHELVAVARDGSAVQILTPNLNVDDIGIGCSD